MRRLFVVGAMVVASCSNGAAPERGSTSTVSGSSLSITTTSSVGSTTSALGTTTTSTTVLAVHANAPSQMPADAVRDGVVAEIADLRPQHRIRPLQTAEAEEGTWALSVLTDIAIDMAKEDGCAIGDSSGQYGVDFVCSVEYGEIVLIDKRGEIAKAYPMPGAKPSWLHLTDQWVYSGRIGDGGLPDATVVRIDRADLSAVVVVMPAPTDGGSSWPPGWYVATADQMERSGPLVGQQGAFDGLVVESWSGRVVVDLDAIDAFVEQFLSAG